MKKDLSIHYFFIPVLKLFRPEHRNCVHELANL